MPSVFVEPPIEKYGQLLVGAGMVAAGAAEAAAAKIAAKKAAKVAARTAAAGNARNVGVAAGKTPAIQMAPAKTLSPVGPKNPVPTPTIQQPLGAHKPPVATPTAPTTLDVGFEPSTGTPQPTGHAGTPFDADPVGQQTTLAQEPPSPAPVTQPAETPAADGKSRMSTALQAAGTTAMLTAPATGVSQNPAVQTAQQSAGQQQQHNLSMQQEATQAAGTTSGTQPGVAYGNTAKSHDALPLLQEGEALRRGGDRPTGNRFVAVARALQKPNEIRNNFIQNYGHQAAQLLGGEPELGELLYQEGRNSPDFLDMRQSPSNYPDEDRQRFYNYMRRLGVGKEREQAALQQGQEMLSQLQTEDPSQYFADSAVRGKQAANPMSLGEGWENAFNKALTPTALAMLAPLAMRSGAAWWDKLRTSRAADEKAKAPDMVYDATNREWHDINPMNQQPSGEGFAENPHIMDLDEKMRQKSVMAAEPNVPANAPVKVLPPEPELDWNQYAQW